MTLTGIGRALERARDLHDPADRTRAALAAIADLDDLAAAEPHLDPETVARLTVRAARLIDPTADATSARDVLAAAADPRVGTVDQVAGQLAEEIGAAVDRLALVLTVGDLDQRLHVLVDGQARALAMQLCSDDDRVAAQTVIDIMCALHPEEPEPGWWRTPLGRQVARSVGWDGSEAVSASVAGAMLGVSPGRVHQLRQAGQLDAHPDGGVTRVSVMQRLAGG